MNELLRKIINSGYRGLFFAVAMLVLVLMVAVHNDYGLTNDEPIHQAHGQVVLDYFRGTDSIAALSPIDSTGNIVSTFSKERNENFRGMNFFGGFFDLTVNYLHGFFPATDLYNFRHLINALFGFLMFLFIGLTAKEINGWRTAVLAFAFAVLSPRLFGHSFANPKDIPFAALYIIGIYFIVRIVKTLPKIRLSDAVFMTLTITVAIDIRVSGLLLAAYLLLSVFAWWLLDFYRTRRIKAEESIFIAVVSMAVVVAGYWGVRFLWPWAANDFWGPVKVLRAVSSFKVFNAYEVFGGNWYNAWEIPWAYAPVWIVIGSPVFITLGMFFIIPVYHRKLRGNLNLFLYSLLIFFTLFPVLYVIIKHSNIYNGIRHLLFVFTTLTVLSALAWEKIINYLKPTAFYFTSILILVASLLQPLFWSIQAHPYEAMYFNPLTGGNKAVFGKYETDYWGISTKEAVEWIAQETDSIRLLKPVKIKMFYGDREKVENYTRKYKNLQYIGGNPDTGWDYEIVYASAGKFNKNLIRFWPPENTVYQVKAAGLPLCAVVKSKYSGLTLKEIAERFPSEQNYVNLSLKYYNEGDYVNAIKASKKVLEINPRNIYALNNIGAAANALKLYDIAYEYLTKALEISPGFTLASNNLTVSVNNIEIKNSGRDRLLNMSLNAYAIGEYGYCVKYSKILTKRNPKDAVAWNNLCSGYNALQKFKEAEKACRKALSIAPGFNLAQNNLRYALGHGKR